MSDFSQWFMSYVYEQIKHGDPKHKAWLKKECMKLAPALDRRLKKLKDLPKDPPSQQELMVGTLLLINGKKVK